MTVVATRSPSLSQYLRAAGRKHADCDAILEAAARDVDLSPGDLAHLVSVLRDRHDGWRLRRGPRDALIDALLAANERPGRIAERLGCDRRTVARRADAEAAQPTPQNGLFKRSGCDKSDGRGAWPILSFDATSGALLTSARAREIQRLLGGES